MLLYMSLLSDHDTAYMRVTPAAYQITACRLKLLQYKRLAAKHLKDGLITSFLP